MKKWISCAAAFVLLTTLTAQCLFFQAPQANAEADPTTWTAVDGLGRTLTVENNFKEDRKDHDRVVGMFFWTWHSSMYASTGAINVQKILDEHPEAKNDYDNEAWGKTTGDDMGYHFWNEPIYGYYSGIDKFVMRKQAEMLADAGVDVIFFDCTNGTYLWDSGYRTLCQVFEDAIEDGIRVPKIAFILNFGATQDAATSLRNLYKNLYSKEKWKDLWFYWDGKPMIMAHKNALTNSAQDQEILNFFTFRRNMPSYFEEDHHGDESWGWLSKYPQAVYYDADGNAEQITVGIAQNADYERQVITAMSGSHVMGRSYTSGDYSYSYTYAGQTIVAKSDMENSKLYGLNFQQQWDYALQVDPEFVFVTGWNEWIAIRMKSWAGDPTVENALVDQCCDEYSRDIEPSTGELKDHYYYQLVENIRRYKGVSEAASPAAEKTIDINGALSQWDSVGSYDHYTTLKNNTRNAVGYGKIRYKNDTFRNDITKAKIAYDSEKIYFYVETREDLTPETDPAWMRLFLDTDATGISANWEGFEYVINRVNPENGKATLEKSTGGWNWTSVGNVDYVRNGKTLQIAVPRALLGLDQNSPSFSFKWSDNMQTDGDILDFYNNGDVAPGGRFCFVAGVRTDLQKAPSSSVDNKPAEEKKSGCGSLLAGGGALSVMLLSGTLLLFRRKKKEN